LSASSLAQQLEREGRKALRQLDLPGTVRARRTRDDALGREHWVVANPQPVLIPPGRMGSLQGDWYLRMSWGVFADPAGGSAIVLMSTLALNVMGIPLTEAAGDECLVRYDTDHNAGAPVASHSPVHLNVLQPNGLRSSVHYPVFGLTHEKWPVKSVLSFFLSEELQRDLEPILGT
jgi:hypothetical protein